MHKAAVASNVLPFVRAAAGGGSNPRRGRKRATGNVLQFTGTKRYNYDREECMKTWRTPLRDLAANLYTKCQRGEVTGMIVICSTGEPSGARLSVIGHYVDDPGKAEYILSCAMDKLSFVIEDKKKEMQEATR